MSCGSSSILVLRSQRPTRVMRGSLRILKIGPLFSFRCSISFIRSSASLVMVRNLIIRKRRLLKPTRSCTKKIGPRESSLIAIATRANKGAEMKRNVIETARSILRFASVRQLNGGTLPSVTIGTPSKSTDCARASFCGNKSDSTCVVIPCSSSKPTVFSICE